MITTKLLKLIGFIFLWVQLDSKAGFSSSDSYTPRTVFGAGGATSFSVMSSSYVPKSVTKPSMTLGLDMDISERWSLNIRTFATQDDSLVGTRLGIGISILSEKTLLMPTNADSSSFVVSSIPNWSFEVGAGLARLVLSQTLESALPFVPANFKNVPVKIPLYGIFIAGLAEYHLTPSWGVYGEYLFTYATGSNTHVISHTLQSGIRLWL